MSDDLRSSSWYRVAKLRPELRAHAQFSRHRYRNERWYVLHDRATSRTHRLPPSAYLFVGLMDGTRSVDEIWRACRERLRDEAPTQDEAIRLLSLLHQADLMRCEVPPDCVALFERSRRRKRAEGLQKLTSPLAVRVPLVDPDRLLERWLPLARPLFSAAGLVGVALAILGGLALAVMHWSSISAGVTRELLEPRNLVILWLVYPLVKIVHEFGHAFAVKVWGGEVHEMGVLFLVFLPVPYVDASSSTAFPQKWRRAAVGAAGIGVELLLAAIALCVWLAVEPGWLRSVAYNVFWIGGLSSLLFNGNPLLRFDGYYVLSDLLEIPNLGPRANEFVGYLTQKYVLRLRQVRNPVTGARESIWLFSYAVLAFGYRMLVGFAIALFLISSVPLLGTALALFATAQYLVLPVFRHVRFLVTAPWIAEDRPRAIAIAVTLCGLAFAAVAAIPVASSSTSLGVVSPPEEASIRAAADGFVVELLVPPGQRVEAGDAVLRTRQLDLENRVAVLSAKLGELHAREVAERGRGQVRSQIVREEIVTTTAELTRAQKRARDLLVRSPTRGRLVLPLGGDLVGRHLSEGELIGYVLADRVDTVRVVISQEDVARIRDDTARVELRVPGRAGQRIEGRLGRQVPAAVDRLPHPALGAMGGGPFATDPEDPSGTRTLDRLFELDVVLPETVALREIGRRVVVRFEHPGEPLLDQATRALRRVLLRHIGV